MRRFLRTPNVVEREAEPEFALALYWMAGTGKGPGDRARRRTGF